MNFPTELEETIEQILKESGIKTVAQAAEKLSCHYRFRKEGEKSFITTQEERIAYAAVRMPATFAALAAVLKQLEGRISPKSLLDLGAGPGTAMWAAAGAFEMIEQVTLVEQDQGLIALGKRLSGAASHPAIRAGQWQQADLHQNGPFASSDLVVISYAIGELEKSAVVSLVEAAWAAAKQAIVIVEPGSTQGFERILMVREALVKSGAHLVAPCPHANQCPLLGKEDWCHFSQRLERSFSHRQTKGATMGYEDEKFSYIIGTKSPIEPCQSRILRHPERHSGHIRFELCTREGLKQETISRKQGERYKRARHLDWGNALPG
jgi:ribosomal protein RSM22 (predicted rRNA methylase)